ncbi:MAG: hypothetical protein D6734_04095 [Candidatus Schekmanbacteria bacterium]|nr:MAG: hypothetical protein D6734_04095 [Candidatus Schekmanbacteria bacterium]
MTDIEILTKYLFTDESSSIPSTGFLFNLITPSGDDEKGLGEGHTGYEIKFLSEKHTEKMRFDLNLGYSFIKEGVDHLFYSFGAEYRISQKIHLVSEIVGEADYRGKNEDPLFLLGGFQFHIKGLQIDTGMRFGLTKETPDYSLVVGITAPLN